MPVIRVSMHIEAVVEVDDSYLVPCLEAVDAVLQDVVTNLECVDARFEERRVQRVVIPKRDTVNA